MSSASFAALRRSQGDELAKLAEEHFKHDLQDRDKEALKSAAAKFSTHAMIGSILGIGLGAFLAFRVRANRNKMFQAFKASERPTAVKFANGREEAIPDLTNVMKPTPLGDIAAYTFFSIVSSGECSNTRADAYLGWPVSVRRGWSLDRELECEAHHYARSRDEGAC